ncbi:helix-turn-helix domain-containing protein [Paenibacillus sp. FSL H8-0034]|uniref:helix-turn-helix domain-containing protein n=1 Tax=Paenibacillus sp. FSL H8-0034 TaxID=2954671 RepID=UPI0030F60573
MADTKKSGISPRLYSRMKTYFFSYMLLVVLLLVGIGGYMNTSFFHTLQGVVEQSNVASLQQIRDQIDQRLVELQRMSVQISRNTKLLPYMITQGGFEAAQANQELRSYGSTSSFLLDIGVYYAQAQANKVYAASGVYDLDTFLEQIYPFQGLNQSAFEKLVSDLKGPLIMPVQSIVINGANNTDATLYLYPVPNNGSTKPYEVIIYVINGAEIKKTVGGALKQFEGMAVVIDKQGKPIVSVSSETVGSLDSAQLLAYLPDQPSASVQTVRLSEGSYSSVRLDSSVVPWSYYVVMPTEQFLNRVRHTQMIFYVTILTTLLLGIVLSYMLATHNYKPIKRLLESLRNKGTSDSYQGKDELGWISRTIEDMSIENSGLRSRLRTKSAMIKEKLLSDLLKGNVKSKADIAELLDTAGMKLGDDHFAVLLFIIDDYRRFEEMNTTIIQNLLKYSIINVAEEISLEAGYGYGIDMTENNGVVVLVGMEPMVDPLHMITEVAEKTRQFFEQSFPFTVTVGVSDIFEDALAIPKYFRQSYESAQYRFMKGHNCVIQYQDLPSPTSLSQPMHEFEEQLVKALKQGSKEGAVRAIHDEMIEIRRYDLAVSFVQSICFRLFDGVVKQLEEINLPLNHEGEREKVALRAFEFETLDEFERAFVRFCGRLADDISMKKESKNFELRDKLSTYIHDNYMDGTLSLSKIAEQFSLSPSYLSRYFKNQMGIGISEYADELRMEKAKELLQTNTWTVKEVTEQVGYADQTYFIRKFKKREGITPQQYKLLSTTGEPFGNSSDPT